SFAWLRVLYEELALFMVPPRARRSTPPASNTISKVPSRGLGRAANRQLFVRKMCTCTVALMKMFSVFATYTVHVPAGTCSAWLNEPTLKASKPGRDRQRP